MDGKDDVRLFSSHIFSPFIDRSRLYVHGCRSLQKLCVLCWGCLVLKMCCCSVTWRITVYSYFNFYHRLIQIYITPANIAFLIYLIYLFFTCNVPTFGTINAYLILTWQMINTCVTGWGPSIVSDEHRNICKNHTLVFYLFCPDMKTHERMSRQINVLDIKSCIEELQIYRVCLKCFSWILQLTCIWARGNWYQVRCSEGVIDDSHWHSLTDGGEDLTDTKQ